jgi:hypothetical protein
MFPNWDKKFFDETSKNLAALFEEYEIRGDLEYHINYSDYHRLKYWKKMIQIDEINRISDITLLKEDNQKWIEKLNLTFNKERNISPYWKKTIEKRSDILNITYIDKSHIANYWMKIIWAYRYLEYQIF